MNARFQYSPAQPTCANTRKNHVRKKSFLFLDHAPTETDSSRQYRQGQTRRTPRSSGRRHRASRVLTNQHHHGAGGSTWHPLARRQVAVSGGSNGTPDYDRAFLNYPLMINDGRKCGLANHIITFGASASLS